MGHARALAGIDNLVLQIKLYKESLLHEWSVRQLEKTIQSYQQDKNKLKLPHVTTPMVNAGLKKINESTNALFGRRTTLKVNKNGSGQVVVPFESLEDLDELIQRLS